MQDTKLGETLGLGRMISSVEYGKYMEYKRTRGHRVIVIRETLWKSILADLVTMLTVIGIIGIGWLMQSTAMQWTGFLMFCIISLSIALSKDRELTIAEARAKLDQWEIRE